MGFFSWSGLSCPPPGDLPDLGVEPASLCLLHWQAYSLPQRHLGGPALAMTWFQTPTRLIAAFPLVPTSKTSQVSPLPFAKQTPLKES